MFARALSTIGGMRVRKARLFLSDPETGREVRIPSDTDMWWHTEETSVEEIRLVIEKAEKESEITVVLS